MRPTVSLLLTIFLTAVTADLLISNTTVHMGGFLLEHSYPGAQVLSGTNNKTDYVCSHLIPAQDDHYISNGTTGPFGSDDLIVKGGLCDSGKLKLLRHGEAYSVHDEEGKTVADCVPDHSLWRKCDMWIGVLFFNSTYRCTGSVCG